MFGGNPGGNPGGPIHGGTPKDRERRAHDYWHIDRIQLVGAGVLVALVLVALAIRLLVL